jgi:hypothetical protein
MLFLFLVYSLIGSNQGDATPISSIPSLNLRADIPCNDLNNCRTISSIVWSCFSTIFLCTWVSLHPNIAIARDTRGMGWFKKLVVYPLHGFMKNKLPLLLCALTAPEYILSWAIRQYLSAGAIKQKGRFLLVPTKKLLNNIPVPGWTRTHGFFVIMGGFHLYRLPSGALSKPFPPEFALPTGFDTIEPLSPHSHEEEISDHPLDFTDLSIRALAYLSPSEAELKDKGKADVLTKAITLIQTLWFVAQCIARGVKNLPLTEIEVVTLAYTMVNVFIYYFWWDKPKDVKCPVRVYKTLTADPVETTGMLHWRSGALGILQKVYFYIGGGQDHFFRLSEEIQVPMFWSGNAGPKVDSRGILGASVIGVAFGATHFIAWNAGFPSHLETLLWRISCIAMTAAPLIVIVLCIFVELDIHSYNSVLALGIVGLIGFSTPLTSLLYLFSRISPFVIAFTTLRALPFDAFKTVDWTTFIPHL